MKKFWRIIAGVSALVLVAVTVTFIVWRPARETGEEDGDFVTYFSSDAVGEDDERLVTSYVTSSDSNFFARGAHLAREMREAARMAPPYLHTFYDQIRRKRKSGAAGMARVFSGDCVLPRLYVTRDCEIAAADGKTRKARAGEELTAASVDAGGYLLADGGKIGAENVRRICTLSDTAGTVSCPYRVDVRVAQYLRFDRAGRLYLTFLPDNECVSLFLEGLPAGSGYELFDGAFRKVGCRMQRNGGKLEIYHQGNVRGAYTLRITCPRASGLVRLTFYRDGNEWQQKMVDVVTDRTY